MLATLTAPVDIYCERTSAAFWAEPLNAASNLSFIAAAVVATLTARRLSERNPAVWLLIALAYAIGIGSFLFHTYAQVWASFADTVPIWSFVALYCFVGASRLGGVRPGWVMAGALAIAAAVTVAVLAAPPAQPPAPAVGSAAASQTAAGTAHGAGAVDPLNGSGQYAPAVAAFALFTLIAFARRSPWRWWVAGAGAVFAVSLTARTFDMAVCPDWPAGLHWLWHLLNGLMIGLVLQIIVRAGAVLPARSPAG